MKQYYSISEIEELMNRALTLRGVEKGDADFIVRDYIEAELEGHCTHGISKFLMIGDKNYSNHSDIKIKKIRGNSYAVDGNGAIGHIAAKRAAELCAAAVESDGICICAVKNISRYSRLSPYADIIADSGNIGIIMNNGGPACVAPFGGASPILGTNPICFGFPGEEENYIFDFSTSKSVWGSVRQAIVDGKKLPEDRFYDKSGNYTDNPFDAVAVEPFGGAKGYALCYALEILTGAFVGAKMGTDSESEYDLGYLMIALSPELFGSEMKFRRSVEKLADDVRNAATFGNSKIRVYIPGERSKAIKEKNSRIGKLLIEEDIYTKLRQMSDKICNVYEDSLVMN